MSFLNSLLGRTSGTINSGAVKAMAQPVASRSNGLRVLPVHQGMGQNVTMAQPQGSAYNPGFTPLQNTQPLSSRQDLQPAPYGAGQPQRSYDQQQRQVGVTSHNLNYLARQYDMTHPSSELMVNVPWAAQQVPYSQSLHAPAGWHPAGTFAGEHQARLGMRQR